MFFRLSSLALLLALTACGSVSEVVAMSTDTYLVSSHGVVGNGASSSEEVKAMQSASVFCQRKSKTLNVLKVEKVEPFFGRAPSASVQFQCV